MKKKRLTGSDSAMEKYINGNYKDTEIVIGLIGAVGTKQKLIVDILIEKLKLFSYNSSEIRISKDIIRKVYKVNDNRFSNEYGRINKYINLGNQIRFDSKNNAILASGVASQILSQRKLDEKDHSTPSPKHAYIINSLKHPEEVNKLREIYTESFYLIGVFSDKERRIQHLKELHISENNAKKLIERDSDENIKHGQHTTATFHLSDFFIKIGNNIDNVNNSILRILELIFGYQYHTPSFDEYAMFLAFSSALRSADLSRQVGAVITKNNEIIAMGANDCPKVGGGLYWPVYDTENCKYFDIDEGRDYKRKVDSNTIEKEKIINNILKHITDNNEKEKINELLRSSQLNDLTEFGRVVHAEMEAILFCARNNINTLNATLYCTTFPCHNCAKHIIAAGIRKVIYVEPYPKSKAFEFHNDSISSDDNTKELVKFIPFVGVGPRKFFDLFSMKLSSGYEIERKSKQGETLDWNPRESFARLQMLPLSYLEKEAYATLIFKKFIEG